ncbi:MAG: GNAT family N-acetyltransferase [Deltaproteobacteria bacterium]|nr:GNAT family N-acetyltransferase [Deltaproteobacteria bacterium]
MSDAVEIREARPDELETLGELTVRAYAQLPGMPGEDVFGEYYADLRDVAGRAARPGVTILVAADSHGALLGGVTYMSHMKSYGAEPAFAEIEAAGFRMLAVDERARGLRLGRGLTEACLARARAAGHDEIILHTTPHMPIARGMYERMGFRRSPDLDFHPTPGVTVMGFRLRL